MARGLAEKLLGEAALKVFDGGLFHYRFYFPPMQAGVHETWWHRPLADACPMISNNIMLSSDSISGYLTAYTSNKPNPDRIQLNSGQDFKNGNYIFRS